MKTQDEDLEKAILNLAKGATAGVNTLIICAVFGSISFLIALIGLIANLLGK